MKRMAVLALLLGACRAALAHHGVAGVGLAALQGPGAPIESATSATLPAGSVLGYLKLDHAHPGLIDLESKAHRGKV
jgi:hypothetical protein